MDERVAGETGQPTDSEPSKLNTTGMPMLAGSAAARMVQAILSRINGPHGGMPSTPLRPAPLWRQVARRLGAVDVPYTGAQQARRPGAGNLEFVWRMRHPRTHDVEPEAQPDYWSFPTLSRRPAIQPTGIAVPVPLQPAPHEAYPEAVVDAPETPGAVPASSPDFAADLPAAAPPAESGPPTFEPARVVRVEYLPGPAVVPLRPLVGPNVPVPEFGSLEGRAPSLERTVSRNLSSELNREIIPTTDMLARQLRTPEIELPAPRVESSPPPVATRPVPEPPALPMPLAATTTTPGSQSGRAESAAGEWHAPAPAPEERGAVARLLDRVVSALPLPEPLRRLVSRTEVEPPATPFTPAAPVSLVVTAAQTSGEITPVAETGTPPDSPVAVSSVVTLPQASSGQVAEAPVSQVYGPSAPGVPVEVATGTSSTQLAPEAPRAAHDQGFVGALVSRLFGQAGGESQPSSSGPSRISMPWARRANRQAQAEDAVQVQPEQAGWRGSRAQAYTQPPAAPAGQDVDVEQEQAVAQLLQATVAEVATPPVPPVLEVARDVPSSLSAPVPLVPTLQTTPESPADATALPAALVRDAEPSQQTSQAAVPAPVSAPPVPAPIAPVSLELSLPGQRTALPSEPLETAPSSRAAASTLGDEVLPPAPVVSDLPASPRQSLLSTLMSRLLGTTEAPTHSPEGHGPGRLSMPWARRASRQTPAQDENLREQSQPDGMRVSGAPGLGTPALVQTQANQPVIAEQAASSLPAASDVSSAQVAPQAETVAAPMSEAAIIEQGAAMLAGTAQVALSQASEVPQTLGEAQVSDPVKTGTAPERAPYAEEFVVPAEYGNQAWMELSGIADELVQSHTPLAAPLRPIAGQSRLLGRLLSRLGRNLQVAEDTSGELWMWNANATGAEVPAGAGVRGAYFPNRPLSGPRSRQGGLTPAFTESAAGVYSTYPDSPEVRDALGRLSHAGPASITGASRGAFNLQGIPVQGTSMAGQSALDITPAGTTYAGQPSLIGSLPLRSTTAGPSGRPAAYSANVSVSDLGSRDLYSHISGSRPPTVLRAVSEMSQWLGVQVGDATSEGAAEPQSEMTRMLDAMNRMYGPANKAEAAMPLAIPYGAFALPSDSPTLRTSTSGWSGVEQASATAQRSGFGAGSLPIPSVPYAPSAGVASQYGSSEYSVPVPDMQGLGYGNDLSGGYSPYGDGYGENSWGAEAGAWANVVTSAVSDGSSVSASPALAMSAMERYGSGANGTVAVQREETGESHGSTSNEHTTAGGDIDELAEVVYAMIRSKLEIERERNWA